MRDDQIAQVARFAGVIRYRYSAETVRIYSAVVRRWFQFGGVPGHIDEGLLRAYLRARTHAVSDAAINIDIKGLRLFYRVQAELGDAAAAELMGHADVSTTARYLGVDLEILRDAVAVHPRARRVVDGG